MAHRAIPTIAFHTVESIYHGIYIYIYVFASLMQVCIVYIVKEVALFQGGLSQLMGVARKRMLHTSMKRYSINMMQESLTSKYNKLLSFRCEEVII